MEWSGCNFKWERSHQVGDVWVQTGRAIFYPKILHFQYPVSRCLEWLSQAHKKSRQNSCISRINNATNKKKNAKKSAKSLWPNPGPFPWADQSVSTAEQKVSLGKAGWVGGDIAGTCSSQQCQCGSCLMLYYRSKKKIPSEQLYFGHWLWSVHTELCQRS